LSLSPQRSLFPSHFNKNLTESVDLDKSNNFPKLDEPQSSNNFPHLLPYLPILRPHPMKMRMETSLN
jgi:hypothetical protein